MKKLLMRVVDSLKNPVLQMTSLFSSLVIAAMIFHYYQKLKIWKTGSQICMLQNHLTVINLLTMEEEVVLRHRIEKFLPMDKWMDISTLTIIENILQKDILNPYTDTGFLFPLDLSVCVSNNPPIIS